MAKIITITCHTAFDYRIEIDKLIPGNTMLADQRFYFAGGKGINVAKAISSLAYPVRALGFVGEQSIDRFNGLANDFLTPDFTAIAGITRTNITLNDSTTETHIRTQGFSVTEADCERLIERLDHCIEANDIVVIAGSLPPGAPDDFLQVLISHCHQRSVFSVLDSNGAGLAFGVKARPHLCKPNLEELSAFSGNSLDSTESIVSAGKALVDSGCQTVVVSLGSQGVLAINSEATLRASTTDVSNSILGTVGCGDVLVAGIVIAQLQSLEFADRIRFGIACATANLATIEPGKIEPARVEYYKDLVKINTIA